MWNYPRYPRSRESEKSDNCISAVCIGVTIVGMVFLAIKTPIGFVRWIAVNIVCIPAMVFEFNAFHKIFPIGDDKDAWSWLAVIDRDGIIWRTIGIYVLLAIVGFWSIMTGVVGFVLAFLGIGMMMGGVIKMRTSLFFKGALNVVIGAVGLGLLWLSFFVWGG